MAPNPINSGDIHGPKPYKFIGFGDIHGPKPYKFIGFGDIHGPKLYKFIWFGDIHGPKPYKCIGFGASEEPGCCFPEPFMGRLNGLGGAVRGPRGEVLGVFSGALRCPPG